MLLQKHNRIETNKACQSIKEVGLFIKLRDVEQTNVVRLLKESGFVQSCCDLSPSVTTAGLLNVIHNDQSV